MKVDFQYILTQQSELRRASAVFALLPDGTKEMIAQNINTAATSGEAKRNEPALIVNVSSAQEVDELRRLHRELDPSQQY